MCGIFGAVAFGDRPLGRPDVLDRMADLLRHRGPDGRGLLRSACAALGACRLRIRDPRAAADQPFADPAEQLWLAVNGEIYNADEIRGRHPRYPYRSRSDVEPLVPLLLDRGPDGIADLDAMFACAAWAPGRGRLLLARDRAGEKPLFYAHLGNELWFASEVQALLAHPDVSRALDPDAVDDYLTLGYVLEPRTMFRQIRKVPAGSSLTFTGSGATLARYWDPEGVEPVDLRAQEAAQRLEALLAEAVARQLTADVPVAVFMSGGVDSSLLAAMAARRLGPDRLRAFTVGFAEPSYDETGPARRAATALGIPHTVIRADAARLREALDVVVARLAEPLADPALLPTLLLARRAREEAGVVLSGEGADELFGGYPTYLGHRAAQALARLPLGTRRALAHLARALPASGRKVSLGFLLKRFLTGLDADWLTRHLHWFGTGLDGGERIGRVRERVRPPCGERVDVLAQAMRLDYRTYLRDGLLLKLDRATMFASLEARAPYLDREVTRFALGLPSRLKVRGLTTKWLLKDVAAAWLPRAVVRRRKRGLSVPIATWLRRELRPEVDRLLSPERVARRGLLSPVIVRQLAAEHGAGREDHSRALWALLLLEYWFERWGE